MSDQKKLAVILGPTAVGKTNISLLAADALNGEIISGDSMQIYRGMDIGTAKIHQEEMVSPGGKYIPHHLIDIVDPDVSFSAAEYQQLARKTIDDILSRGKLPILVGGTGLYINAVIDPYVFSDIDQENELREKYTEELRRFGPEHLHRLLAQVDPESAQRLHPHDTRRIIRALEVFELTGEKIASVPKPQEPARYQLAMIGLTMDRPLLYQRINERVDRMMEMGLINEVKELLAAGYHPCLNSMQGLGYRQIAGYLSGLATKEEAVRILKRDTRRYAKRQLTWFKRDQRVRWFDLTTAKNSQEYAEKIINYIGRTLDIYVE